MLRSAQLMMFVYRLFMASMATSIGVPAGLLTPSLVTGGYLGSAIGSAAKSIGEATDMYPYIVPCRSSSPWFFYRYRSPSFVRYLHQTGVLFGMTGMFSSWFRTPITAVVIAYELTGVYSLVLPIMLCNYLSSALISLVYEKDVTEHMMERAGVSAEGAHFELTDVRHLFKSRLAAMEYDYRAEHPSIRTTDRDTRRRFEGPSRTLDRPSRRLSLSNTMMRIITPNVDVCIAVVCMRASHLATNACESRAPSEIRNASRTSRTRRCLSYVMKVHIQALLSIILMNM